MAVKIIRRGRKLKPKTKTFMITHFECFSKFICNSNDLSTHGNICCPVCGRVLSPFLIDGKQVEPKPGGMYDCPDSRTRTRCLMIP